MFGLLVTVAIIWYFANKYSIVAAIGVIISLAFIAFILYLVWTVAYPNDMWYFWILVGIAVTFSFVISTLRKIAMGN